MKLENKQSSYDVSEPSTKGRRFAKLAAPLFLKIYLFLAVGFFYSASTTAQVGYDFDPTDRVTITNAGNSLSGLSTVTVEFWVKLDALSSNSIFVQMYIPGLNASAGGFAVLSDGTLAVSIFNDFSSLTTSSTAASFTTGGSASWHHLAYVFNSGTWTFYFDGSQLGTTRSDGEGLTSFPNYVSFGNTSLIVGNDISSSGALAGFDGSMDELRVWNDVRTALEIDGNKDSEITSSESNLFGYWQFNETSGQTVEDAEPPGVTPTYDGLELIASKTSIN